MKPFDSEDCGALAEFSRESVGAPSLEMFQVGQYLEQPGIGEGVPLAEGGTGWALTSFPTKSWDFV